MPPAVEQLGGVLLVRHAGCLRALQAEHHDAVGRVLPRLAMRLAPAVSDEDVVDGQIERRAAVMADGGKLTEAPTDDLRRWAPEPGHEWRAWPLAPAPIVPITHVPRPATAIP